MSAKTLCIIFAAIILALVIGRYTTIHQAELYNITDNSYNISFGNEIHSYTFN